MVVKGFYRHWKGPVYYVSSVGCLHDQDDKIVIYESTQSVIDGRSRLRYERDFEEWVDPANNGATVPEGTQGAVLRFERIE